MWEFLELKIYETDNQFDLCGLILKDKNQITKKAFFLQKWIHSMLKSYSNKTLS